MQLAVNPKLARLRYLDYTVATDALVLGIASRRDRVVTERNGADFAQELRAGGVEVTLVTVPGGHGGAFGEPATRAAISRLRAGRPPRGQTR